jgi:hypothetical protein
MEYPIEKNVPVPTPIEEKHTKYAHLKFKADLMEVGDSLWVPTSYAADRLRKYLDDSKRHLYEYKLDPDSGWSYTECLFLKKKELKEGYPDGYRVWYLNKDWVLKSNIRLSKLERTRLGFSDKENRAYFLRVHNLDHQGNPK